MKRIIAYFHTSATAPSARKITGVYKAAHERAWSVIRFDAHSPRHVRGELAYWQPDGCIVDAVAAEPGLFKAFGRKPAVFLDCNLKDVPASCSCLYRDPEAVARAAVEELLRHQIATCGFVTWSGDPDWSKARGEAFARIMKARGVRVENFRYDSKATNRGSVIRSLADWLKTLAAPIGIFAAADALSEQVLEAARTIGLAVPDQLAIFGVDDDEFFCEHARPMLSSASPDFEGAGRRAAEILDKLMTHPKLKPIREPMSAVYTTVRASTRRSAKHDSAVSAALDLIREKATTGLAAGDVLGRFPCSRRLAEQRFRAFTGHTVTEEIHLVQIEHAKRLIANPLQKLTTVPELCGHRAAPYFQKIFLRHVGMTMSAYRSAGT